MNRPTALLIGMATYSLHKNIFFYFLKIGKFPGTTAENRGLRMWSFPPI